MLLLILSGCIASSDRGPRLVLCGDSTMADYSRTGGVVGWGEVLHLSLNRSASILDLAIPGANAQSFLKEGLPSALATHPDVALVQFGHNAGDSLAEAKALDSIAGAFRRFGAKVVFVAPMTARSGVQLQPQLDSGIRQAATRLGCPIIRLDSSSRRIWQQTGSDSLPLFFVDVIHLTGLGALRIAPLVARDLVAIEPELSP